MIAEELANPLGKRILQLLSSEALNTAQISTMLNESIQTIAYHIERMADGRWTANKVIDSRNCYELLKRGYMIPRNRGYYAYVRMVKEIVLRDRGGMIISPKIEVVHENVAELNFASQYPNLIVRNNLSYETVTPATPPVII